MPSRFARAIDATRNSLPLAVIPAAATLLSFSEIARALAAGPGGGVTFPFPAGLPTLWTYVSSPHGPIVGAREGPFSLTAFVAVLLVGLLLTSALEAGFLGALWNRLEGDRPRFAANVRRFTGRIVGVNLLQMAIVLAVAPLVAVPPVAMVVVLVLAYLVYGLPFEVVVHDASFGRALNSTLSHAVTGADYAVFGVAHLVIGALVSVFLTGLVRNGGLPGILLATAVVAVPAVFVATYGLLVVRSLGAEGRNEE